MAVFLVIVALTAVARADGQRLPAPTLDLSFSVDALRACRDERGDAAELTVRLRVRNRGTTPARVLPDTLRLTSVQMVRTVEELVPQGPDTPGVRVLPAGPRAATSKGPARLVRPGESIDVVHRIAVDMASPHTPDPYALEPGHYFLELTATIEAATAGDSRFATRSIVSPYIPLNLPPPSGPCQDDAPPSS